MDNILVFGINVFSEQPHWDEFLAIPFSTCTENPTKSGALKCFSILANPALGGNLKVPPHRAEKKQQFSKNPPNISELNERFFV